MAKYEEVWKAEKEKLEARSEEFRKGVAVALKVGGKKKGSVAPYYLECRKRGAEMADGFEYGLLLAIRLLQALPQMQEVSK